jgi:integrase/predicted RNA-binding Zn-ribbon protein involved in translation (DUF1610 family)
MCCSKLDTGEKREEPSRNSGSTYADGVKNAPAKESTHIEVKCPHCGSRVFWRDGFRQLKDGQRQQRYYCRLCGFRYSEPEATAATSIRGSKSVGSEECNVSQPVQNEETGDIAKSHQVMSSKGKIINHGLWMRKQGYADSTISRRIRLLTTLAKRGAEMLDPESVKTVLAKQNWAIKTKALAVDAYTGFLKMHGGVWQPPKYKPVRKLPFIPTEKEIDELVAACNKKTATFLQLLKETGVRSGEAWMLKWIDFDFEGKTVRITPEKGGEPRLLKISDRLIAMLNNLSKDHSEVFTGSLKHFRRTYRAQRKRATYKLKNKRTDEITFHTFRHWKATMEYAKTKDILHVMQLLGHKNIQNTLKYTQLVNFESDEFHTAVAQNVEKACKLIEAGFEFVTGEYGDGGKIFRKRK